MEPDSGADADGLNRDVLPVVVQDQAGAVVAVAATNDKGHKKSIERGELWIVDEQTGRLLPHPGPLPVTAVTRQAGWYLATTPGGGDAAGVGPPGPRATPAGATVEKPETKAASTPAGTAGTAGTETGAGAQSRGGAAGASMSAPGAEGGSGTDAAGGVDVAVLADLWATIQERNHSRPEGSYTTHLFTQGEEKIRKKTGEEAVELLLARSTDETVHEAADLIYHLLVLLESTGVGIDALLAELRRRAG